MIVGVDEVGRGCLAGPVCVGAVALHVPIEGLDDSKKLVAPTRERLAVEIKRLARYVGLGWASSAEIDAHGLTAALRLAAERALAGIGAEATEILLDGRDNYLRDPRVHTIIGGDALDARIAAASVVAKVARDSYMHAMGRKFPHYGFASHVGYGTKAHRTALDTHGPCWLHRQSFAPVKALGYANY